jgi:PAS domain S-box-containing protein
MSDTFHQSLLDVLPDAVFVVAASGALQYANPSSEALFGWRAEERIGTSMLGFVHPDDLTEILQLLTSTARCPFR